MGLRSLIWGGLRPPQSPWRPYLGGVGRPQSGQNAGSRV
jgi:hypothetical protein